MSYLVGYVTPQDYGAAGNGIADDTSAIQSALNAVGAGQVVYLPAGTYKVSSPITIPSSVSLVGASAQDVNHAGVVSSVLKPSSTFSGTEVLYLRDNATAAAVGGTVQNLSIDGSSYTAAALDGIRGFGPVYLAHLSGLSISSMSGWGINTVVDSGSTGAQYPYWWDVRNVLIDNCASGGCQLISMTDATFTDVYVIACGKGATPGPGWLITFAGNSHFTNCRGEWCGTNGWHLTGAWWTGTGSGGCTLNGCSTDRNERDGLLIDATGNGPVIISNFMARRDGRNAKSGGGSYCGVNISSATVPVVIGTLSVFPGVDDDGTGTNSPQIGYRVASSTATALLGGYVQAATTALSLDASGWQWVGPGILTATGTPASVSGLTGQKGYGFTEFASVIYADAGLDVDVAGQGLAVKEGANAKQGTATLNGTTSVVVSNTAVTANSRIFLTIQSRGSVNPPGSPYVVTRTAGTSFTIASTVASDNSVVAYEIIEPG